MIQDSFDLHSIKMELAGITHVVPPHQVDYYKAIGWKIPGADQDTPKPKADGALPKTKKVKK